MMKIENEEALQAHLTALRREFHEHPELSMQEYETARRIERELDALGIEHRRIGETGVLGILKGTGAGEKIIALRADIDALPIQELSDCAYRSRTDGVMHACGHDGHTACLLGAAQILRENLDAFGGEIRLIFQPGEEIGRGTQEFFDAGVLEGVGRVFGLHTAPEVDTGVVGVKPGLNNASVDFFRVTIHGKSAHVSTPHLGVDALYIASQFVVAAQALVTRRRSPVEPLILGIGKLNAGTTYNALADFAVLEGTTRTVSFETRDWVKAQIDALAAQIAALYGGSAEVYWDDYTPPLINDPEVCREVTRAAETVEGLTVWTERPLSLSGDNFADFQLRAPGVYAYLGSGSAKKPGTQNAGHSVNFDLDEDALLLGAKLYAAYALQWLNEA